MKVYNYLGTIILGATILAGTNINASTFNRKSQIFIDDIQLSREKSIHCEEKGGLESSLERKDQKKLTPLSKLEIHRK